MRTFIENCLHFMKNCIRPHYEKLNPLKSGFIENSNFENNRDPGIALVDQFPTILLPPPSQDHHRGQIGYNIRVQSIWEKYHHPTTIEAKKNKDIALVYILYTISESRLQIQVDQLNTRRPIQASSGTTRPD